MKRSFFQYVSLNVLGALGLSGYILADTLFVAHRLGTDGLAALILAISVFGLINGLGLMLGIGGATRYAICRTQEDGVRADRAFSRALACGGALGGSGAAGVVNRSSKFAIVISPYFFCSASSAEVACAGWAAAAFSPAPAHSAGWGWCRPPVHAGSPAAPPGRKDDHL